LNDRAFTLALRNASGDLKQAETDCRKAMSGIDTASSFYFACLDTRGFIEYRNKNYDDAIKDFTTALSSASYTNAFSRLGTYYHRALVYLARGGAGDKEPGIEDCLSAWVLDNASDFGQQDLIDSCLSALRRS
jgi:tetratricopeptide (TPR) repeat protein